MDIRKSILKIYNKQESDFPTLKEYNDYLEEIEDIVWNLESGRNEKETREKIAQYKYDFVLYQLFFCFISYYKLFSFLIFTKSTQKMQICFQTLYVVTLLIVKCDHDKFLCFLLKPKHPYSKQSRLCCLKNGISQGAVLATFLFNIYMYDLPSLMSKKFAYADDLALLHSFGNLKGL